MADGLSILYFSALFRTAPFRPESSACVHTRNQFLLSFHSSPVVKQKTVIQCKLGGSTVRSILDEAGCSGAHASRQVRLSNSTPEA